MEFSGNKYLRHELTEISADISKEGNAIFSTVNTFLGKTTADTSQIFQSTTSRWCNKLTEYIFAVVNFADVFVCAGAYFLASANPQKLNPTK